MINSRRRLPNWIPDGVPVFVTFRLAGTLPVAARGARFIEMDSELDRANTGARWLTDNRIARLLVDALRHGEQTKKWYVLHAYVVTPNHVHVVWTPHISMSRILYWLKRGTAYRAKRLLGWNEQAFWQDESFDHWIRSDRGFNKIIRYVEFNPVKAGLTSAAEDWPWSSAYRREDEADSLALHR